MLLDTVNITNDLDEPVMVSIKCMVYNHAPFLRKCLDGFIMQKTKFKFEVIVHDDASTDDSTDIIKEYAEKYPDIIKPIFETENQYSKGDGSVGRIMNAACHGKYIAICEGDDFWTNSHKLQRQVDFLESHQDYMMCSHNYKIFDGTLKPHFIDVKYQSVDNYNYYTADLNNYFDIWVCSPLTLMYRNIDFWRDVDVKKFPAFYDLVSYYYIIKKGKCALLKDNMAVYRRHDGGIYSGKTKFYNYSLELKMLYKLYDVEKEKTIINGINKRVVGFFFYVLQQKKYHTAIAILLKYCTKVPLKYSLNFIFDILIRRRLHVKIFS